MLPSRDSLRIGITSAVRGHERRLAIAYLAAVAVALSAFFVPPVQRLVLSQVERVADYVDNRWARSLREGERLVAEEQYEEAAELLGDLADRFPARNARHARTLEMQRTLGLLGSSHHALGRKARTLDAYREAVRHDPRNYSNHLQLARAALALDEPEEARQHFESVLSIHPSHLASVEEIVQIAIDGEDARGVVEAYERYLGALVIREIEVRFGDLAVLVPVIADGRARATELSVSLPEDWSGELWLSADGAVPDLEWIELRPPLRVGQPGGPGVELPMEGELRRPSSGGGEQAVGRYSLVLRVPPQPGGVARAVMRVRLLKPVHADTWRTVEGAYATVLDRAGALGARERSFIVESEE